MKRKKQKMSEAEILAHYPEKSKVPGWYFRIQEVSNSVWCIEGSDRWGRKVSRTGTEPEKLLEDCEKDALKINFEVNGK